MSSPGDMVRGNPRSLWGDSNANSPIVRDGRRREREEGVNTTPLEPPRQRSDIINPPYWVGSADQQQRIRELGGISTKTWDELTEKDKEALETIAKYCPHLPDSCLQAETRSRRLLRDCQLLTIKLKQLEIQVEHANNVRKLAAFEEQLLRKGGYESVQDLSPSSDKCPYSPIEKGDKNCNIDEMTRDQAVQRDQNWENESKGSSKLESGFQSADKAMKAQLSRQPDMNQAWEINNAYRTHIKMKFDNSEPFIGKGQLTANTDDLGSDGQEAERQSFHFGKKRQSTCRGIARNIRQ